MKMFSAEELVSMRKGMFATGSSKRAGSTNLCLSSWNVYSCWAGVSFQVYVTFFLQPAIERFSHLAESFDEVTVQMASTRNVAEVLHVFRKLNVAYGGCGILFMVM